MIRRPPRSTLDRSSAASDVYKRQGMRRLNEYRERSFYHRGNMRGLHVMAMAIAEDERCLLYTSPSPRDRTRSRMPSSA